MLTDHSHSLSLGIPCHFPSFWTHPIPTHPGPCGGTPRWTIHYQKFQISLWPDWAFPGSNHLESCAHTSVPIFISRYWHVEDLPEEDYPHCRAGCWSYACSRILPLPTSRLTWTTSLTFGCPWCRRQRVKAEHYFQRARAKQEKRKGKMGKGNIYTQASSARVPRLGHQTST